MTTRLALLFGLVWGCGSKIERPHATDADSDIDTDTGPDTDTGSETDIPPATLRLTRVEPTHGPWTGGNAVEIRGDGFRGPLFFDRFTIEFDGIAVDPLDIEVATPQTLRVLRDNRHLGIPAGAVGPADIRVTFDDPDDPGPPTEAVLPGGGDFGYTYDAFYLEPTRGTIGGGTKVSLFGSETIWNSTALVTFDGVPAEEVEVLSATRIDCKTPPGEQGPADVRVEGGAGDTAFADEVKRGFEYYNSADPIGGGLGGGPLDGQMNVTVLDMLSLLPIEGAFVIVDVDGATDHQGLTSALGQIAFDGDDLVGRHQVTASKEGYESGGFIQFDARDATIFLLPIPDPNPGPPPPGRLPTTIDGVLVFDGPNEFGPNPWIIIPDPVDPDEVKTCYVATTQSDIYRENPSPGGGRRVLEVDPGRYPIDDYRYQIIARPAAMAVWAVCGLENERTSEFLPYAMGVRRNVLGGPGEFLTDQDIHVDIPLDHLARVNLECTAPEGEYGPDRYRVDGYIDLGGEGVIARDDRSIGSIDPGAEFRFGAQPPLMSNIADAQFWFVGGGYTGVDEQNPFSVVIEKEIFETADPIVIEDFLGVPNMVDPPYGGTIADNTLTWEAEGCGVPTFNMLIIQTNEAIPRPVWRLFVKGDVTTVTLPDIETIAGLPPPPDGYLVSILWAVHVPGLSFDEFSYTYAFSQNWWRKYSADAFLFQY